MAESKLEQALDSFVFCSLCKEVYDEGDHLAKYLPCLHSFCQSCLQTCVGNESHLNCPKCQLKIDLKEGCVDNLPDNFIVWSLEKELGDLHVAESCGSCDDEKSQVTSFCHDCSCYLCPSCIDSHKKLRALRNHKLAPIQMKISIHNAKKQKFCNEHSNQELTVFCSECQLPACNTCSTEDHAKHCVIQLDNAVEELIAEIQGVSSELGEKKHDILLQSGVIKSTQTMLKAKFEQKVRVMEVEKQKLINSIESRFNEAYMDLKNMYEKETSRLPNVVELDSIAEQIGTANEFANTACTTKANVQFLASGQQIKSRLCELQKYKLPDIPIDIKSDVVFTYKHNGAVKQMEEIAQNVLDVKWLSAEQDQVRKDKEKDQEIDLHHCSIENFKLENACNNNYELSYCRTYCGCSSNSSRNSVTGTLHVLNVKGQPLTSGATCSANVEILSQGTSLQKGKASGGRFNVQCNIAKGLLPEVRINGNNSIGVTKMFLGI